MKARKLAGLAGLAFNFAFIAWVVWREAEAFEEFQVGSRGAGVGAFMVDRGPYYLSVVIGVVAIFALAMWLERLPATDADRTEFHEKETH